MKTLTIRKQRCYVLYDNVKKGFKVYHKIWGFTKKNWGFFDYFTISVTALYEIAYM